MAVVTWNLAARSPVAGGDCRFLERLAAAHDVIVIACQEVEDVKPRRAEGRRSKFLRALCRRVMSKKLGFRGGVARAVSGGCQILVASKLRRWSVAGSADVACGVGNVLRNKGAVGFFLELNGCRVTVVGAHLAAHAPRVAQRNADYARIVDGFREAAPSGGSSTKRGVSDAHGATCIFCGDLNYRLEARLSPAEVSCAAEDGELDALFEFDQLTRERAAGRVFDGFGEGRVAFRPTYKYYKRADRFDITKIGRAPAWTDRVLYTPGNPGLKLLSYDWASSSHVSSSSSTHGGGTHSDHRPVAAVFELDPRRWASPSKGPLAPSHHPSRTTLSPRKPPRVGGDHAQHHHHHHHLRSIDDEGSPVQIVPLD